MIPAIRAELGREEVEHTMRSTAANDTARAERRLYYPYFWLQVRWAARTLLGRSALSVSCMVDARTRVSATADPFEVELVDPDERDVVASRMDEREAARIAGRYTGYVLRNKRRALVSPTVDVVSSRLVYKPFWIVTYTESSTPVRVLVDGITGGFHPLRFSGMTM